MRSENGWTHREAESWWNASVHRNRIIYLVEILRREIDPEDEKVEMSSRRGARIQLTPMRATEPADDD